jgi:hypothetical protein
VAVDAPLIGRSAVDKGSSCALAFPMEVSNSEAALGEAKCDE